MGTLTRAQLRSEVNKNLGDPESSDSGATARLNQILNFAQLQIARRRDYQEMRTRDSASITVTGTPATDKLYTHGISNLRKLFWLIRQVGSDRGVKLVRLLDRQWAQLLTPPDAYGTSDTLAYIEASKTQLEWFPVPGQNFTLYRAYSKWPTTLSAEGTPSDLDNKDDLIVAKATHFAFQSTGAREDAATWFAIARNLERDAILEDKRQPDRSAVPRGISEANLIATNPVSDPFHREPNWE